MISSFRHTLHQQLGLYIMNLEHFSSLNPTSSEGSSDTLSLAGLAHVKTRTVSGEVDSRPFEEAHPRGAVDVDFQISSQKKASIQPESVMHVRKRNGSLEPVDVIQITKKVARFGVGLGHINPYLVASRAISGIYNGVTTTELDSLLIQTSAMLISEEPEYSKLASRLLTNFIDKEVGQKKISSFSLSIAYGHKTGLISDRTAAFVRENERALNEAILEERCDLFEYFGLRTVYDRYLLRDPQTRQVVESAQFFFMRVACGLANHSIEDAIEFYQLISSFQYMPATPTLFNSGTQHEQMSSCYLLDSPTDSLEAIYQRYLDIALLSKYAGGIGVSFSRVRSFGSLIAGTNGKSNGIIPFLKTLDSSVSAVNQGGKRKGAACVYLETWHADIMDFLSLRDNTGDGSLRAHNLNLAHWVPDLFMERVEQDAPWSLFDPKTVPQFIDLFGAEFKLAYEEAEEKKLFSQQVKARELYGAMMKTLAQTGNGWMTFKDASNRKSNQTYKKEHVIHLSNLCTEILEVTSSKEIAVCNLGSINLGQYIRNGKFDFDLLAKNVKIAVKYLDRVIDINFYPIEQTRSSNQKWRPVGLGIMGLQNVFFELKLPFDSAPAKALSRVIQEEIYFHALSTSQELAEKEGAHPNFHETWASEGVLQFDLWSQEEHRSPVELKDKARWDKLKDKIKKTGLRNSLLIAIAPTATIASITGAYECIEAQISNLFKRETLSGEFLQVNPYLIADLRKLNLWTENVRKKIKLGDGSIQQITEIPEELREIYRTTWEIPQKALIDMAAERGPFIDQSQSLNLFLESPTIGKLSSMYFYAWKSGLKTTYYMRSRSATKILKTTIDSTMTESAAVACSLENPESCEACT
ncbi:MAG: ribonucleoside-diphosphate reductase subunit alpha [Oligoflexales bacterium]|nr:ribonucleoside-diphosphate reductase subunit alpha [Oligoflexales bacterium]